VRRSLGGVAVVAIAGLALSGCGVANQGLRPGLAAQVGDATVDLDTVDDNAANLCDMITFLAESGASSGVPGAVVRDNALRYAVLREMGDQLGDEYDVQAGDDYRDSLDRNESQLSELGVSQGVLDDVVPTLSSGDYFLDIVQQIGWEKLGMNPDLDTNNEGISEGLKVAKAWEDEHGLEVNPRFADMSIGDLDQIVTSELDELSVPVSDFAKQALVQINPADPNAPAEPDTTYLDSLPASQRCG
jgi:hypothetical protein